MRTQIDALRALMSEPWAIHPEALAAIQMAFDLQASGGEVPAKVEGGAFVAAHDTQVGAARAGSIAVLPVHGAISHRADLLRMLLGLGSASVDSIKTRMREALADDEVSAIVLDVESPGGTVDGVPELAAEMRAMRGDKPIVAVADTYAASAAYWIASAADEIVVTPSGEVGSIGVFSAHMDISGWQEKMGIKTTLVSAGKHKTEGNPYEPLSDDARAYMQSRVDDHYAMFVDAVAAGRNVKASRVQEDFGGGRMIGAAQAVTLGMADRVDTLEGTIARLAKPQRQVSRRARRRRII